MAGLQLVWPSREYLPGFIDALEHGWSPDNVRGAAVIPGFLERIAQDPDGFLSTLMLRDPQGVTIALPDGTEVPRLPGYNRWLWDGEFCGSIGFRWQPGSNELPPYVMGHIGYSVVPWKQRRGYATEALRQLLPDCAHEGLRYVYLTTEAHNVASQKTILKNGGVFLGTFDKTPHHGGGKGLRYRIDLVPSLTRRL